MQTVEVYQKELNTLWASMDAYFSSLSPKAFREMVSLYRQTVIQKDQRLEDSFLFNWNHVLRQTYNFDSKN